MDLIDRDTLNLEDIRLDKIEDLIRFLVAVDVAPSVDAVPVVRCKDCKYKQTEVFSTQYGRFLVCIIFRGKRHQPNDFCSYGERKEE